MSNYLAFLESGIAAPGVDLTADGRRLAAACMKKLKRLNNQEQFPPKLLILLTSPEFTKDGKVSRLLAGIYQEFDERNVPLIGSSVAAVFYNRRIREKGALLICLASRLIEARVAVGENANCYDKVDKTIRGLVTALQLSSLVNHNQHDVHQYAADHSLHINSLDNTASLRLPHKLLLAFFPGSGPSPLEARRLTEKLHDKLWQEVGYQIPIVGGVSSVNDPDREEQTFQFVNQEVYKDAIAVTLINSGIPLGERLTNGVKWSEDSVLKVAKISDDDMTIEAFDNGTPDKVIKTQDPIVLFKEHSRSSDHIVAISEYGPETRAVRILHKVSTHSVLVPGRPTRRMMYEKAESAIERSKDIMHIKNPIGCLSIKCTSHYRYRRILDLDIEKGITNISKSALKGRPYVGGFFDGEIGTDKSGRSIYGNWGVATVVLGDEMTDSTLMQRGYELMRTYSAKMSGTTDLNEVINKSLDLIYGIGFPGAMISLLLPHHHRGYLLAQDARGARLSRLKKLRPTDLQSKDILARILRGERRDHFIHNSRRVKDSQKIVKGSGIISQYIIPLKDPNDNPLALLQVDLGTAKELSPAEEEMLESIGAFVGAILNRVFSWKESEIVRKLDEALVQGLSAEGLKDGLQIFIEHASKAFDLEMGHIRLINQERNHLILIAGVGEYYKAAQKARPVIGLEDESPTVDAFKNTKDSSVIINDTQRNSGHQKLCQRFNNDFQMDEALNLVRSYANVPFSIGKRTIGTVNLLSTDRWFFRSYHQHALDALGRRVGFLVAHLNRKHKDNFLQLSSPVLSEIENFDETSNVLDEATENFCTALGAEYAALYLEDENKNSSLYILRAERGWESGDKWVGHAFYTKDDGWIGNEAVKRNEPIYSVDLYKEYQRRAYPSAMKRYAKEIFGEELSKAFTVEALALPLKVGVESLGVLTLYCRINPKSKQPSSFATTDPDLLKRAVNPFAGLVKLVRSHQNKIWDTIEAEKRSTINERLALQDTHYAEARICRRLLDLLSAKRVEFFKLEGLSIPKWITGLEINEEKETKKTSLAPVDQKILDVAGKCKVILQEAPKSKKSYKGRLNRACIPLLASNNIVGILDVYWDSNEEQDPPLIGERGEDHLFKFGILIGNTYRQHDLAAINDRRRLVVDILNSVMMARSHDLKNLILSLKGASEELQRANDEEGQRRYTEKMIQDASAVEELIEKRITLGPKVLKGNLELLSLKRIINKVLDNSFFKGKTDDTPIVNIAPDIKVIGVRQIIEEVFTMLVKNAVEAMTTRKERRLCIEAETDETKKNVKIFIRDTGKGEASKINVILSKTYEEKTPQKIGGKYRFGIYFSIELLHYMQGTLSYDTNPGGGVTTLVTLPLKEQEETE